MFNFLKKLFKTQEEDVSLERLEQWFREKTDPIYSNLNEQLKEQINSIPGIIEAIKQDISELEKADIKDEEKIEPKIKQVVLGHRKNYIRLINQFIDSVEIPDEINAKISVEFNSEMNNKLDELGKNTQKTFYAVQHLFANNVEKVANNIKDISKINQTIKTNIEKNNIAKIEETKAKIKGLIQSVNRKERLKQNLIDAKERLNKSQKLKQEAETKLINLKNSDEYVSFNELKQEHDEIKSRIHNIKNQIKELFSSLIPGLKKFQRITLENDVLIGKYVDNPDKTLLEDRNLEIISILQGMKKSILSNSIDLRDKKREKALEKIDQTTKEQLRQIFSDYDKLKGKERTNYDKLKSSRIMPLIDEAQYKLEHHTQMVEKIKKDIIKTEEDVENINIDEEGKEVKNKIKETTNIEAKLLFSNP
ncbi:hypothetical protein KY343_01165 [Candidatus Woesearchaeota archaeon]|nr:hypothetical protein [Candidatus Woesearchaeota archaeon]